VWGFRQPEKCRTHNYKEVQKNVLNKNEQEEPVRIGGWPPISTWINPPPLGRNDLHCVEFPYQVRKLLLDLAPGEPLALVEELLCLDNSIKLDPLLVSALDLCFHYLISGCLFHAVRVELCWCQLLCDL
jgi:hypothetical protein